MGLTALRDRALSSGWQPPALCSLSFGWLIGRPLTVIIVVGAVYGFSALGDSPVLSTALSEAVPAAYLASALAPFCRRPGTTATAVGPIIRTC